MQMETCIHTYNLNGYDFICKTLNPFISIFLLKHLAFKSIHFGNSEEFDEIIFFIINLLLGT